MPNDRSISSSAPLDGNSERSGEFPSRGAAPDPEVLARARRRSFTAEYKACIVREADACRDERGIGALLRREGLYSSLVAGWRKQLRAHGVDGLASKKRGPAPKSKKSAREIELERKVHKLEKQVAQRDAVIEFQKKVHELLGIPLKSHEIEGDD